MMHLLLAALSLLIGKNNRGCDTAECGAGCGDSIRSGGDTKWR